MGCCTTRDLSSQAPTRQTFEASQRFAQIEEYGLSLCSDDKWDTEIQGDQYTICGKSGSPFHEDIPVVKIQITMTPRIALNIVEKVLEPQNRLNWDKQNVLDFRVYPDNHDSAKSYAYIRIKFPWPLQSRDFYEKRYKKIVTADETRLSYYGSESPKFPPMEGLVRGSNIFGMTRVFYANDSTVIQMVSQTDTKLPVNNTQLAAMTMKQWVAKFIKEIKSKSSVPKMT